MATLSTFPTLLDVAKSLDPDGKTADVVELLHQTNPVLQDLPFKEGNLPTGHQHTIRTGLPDAFWGRAYKGVPISKSARATVTDTCGYLQARSEVDKIVCNLNGNSPEFRLSEAKAFIEAMNQEMVRTFFYGNTDSEPEKFMGLAPRYNDPTAVNGRNILNAGGSGDDTTSLWLVTYGDQTTHGIFPKGFKAGIDHQDLGELDAFDDNDRPYRALGELYTWHMGLTVRDWRYNVRIANIEVSDLANAGLTAGATQALTAATNLVRLFVQALRKLPHAGMGKTVAYANREVTTALHLLALERSSSAVAFYENAANQFGQVNTELRVFGVPVRQVDAILSTETALTFPA